MRAPLSLQNPLLLAHNFSMLCFHVFIHLRGHASSVCRICTEARSGEAVCPLLGKVSALILSSQQFLSLIGDLYKKLHYHCSI